LSDNVSKPEDLLVPGVTEDGLPPCSRVKDADSLREIYKRLKDADRVASSNRAEVQAMFDGQPPYDEAELRATGQAFRCNLNFDEASSLLEQSVGQYTDLLNSVENLVTVKTRVGSEAQRAEWEPIIAEEVTHLLRAWPEFHTKYLLLAHHFISHGVGIALFEDEVDWRWSVIGLGDFLMPRKTLASEGELEIAVARRSYQAHQLYRYIEDPETAAKTGWDVEAVREALLGAKPKTIGSTAVGEWEEYQTELKNNDLHYTHASASEIKVLHGWVQEFTGEVSHYIALEDDTAENKWLYSCRCRFPSPSHAFVVFPYGVGSNGYYHSIRGLGHRIFPHIQVSNRLRSQLVDGAMLASSLLIVPETEEALDSLAFSYYGPYAVMNPGFNIAERAVPDFSKNVLPVLADMTEIVGKKVGQYNVSEPASSREKTRYEVQAQLQEQARVSTASLNLFYEPWNRLLRSVVSRLIRRDYSVLDPGGREVIEFRKRCLERGVPSEALYKIDVASVKAVRALGNGSEQMRTLALTEFTEMIGSLDDVGRRNLIRDRIAARIGYESADRYAPKPTPDGRPVMDEKIAELENGQMRMGSELRVLPNENHIVHARIHLQAMAQVADSVEQGQVPVEQVIDFLAKLFTHTEPHVAEASRDALLAEEAASLRKALQNFGEIVTNGLRKVKAAQEKAQEEQVAAGPMAQPQVPQIDPQLESKVAEHQMKLQMMQEQHQAKMQMQIAEAQQKLALRDAETARRIATP
jgi:hypothetical protein